MNPVVAKDRVSVRASLWASGLFFLALLAIYHETAWSIVYIWWRSDTYAHGFLILPISLWLIWSRRDLLSSLRPRPAFGVVLFVLPLGLVWLLAALVDIAVIQHLMLVAILVTGIWAIIGHELGRVLLFPLLFLFFAVPLGEGLIPSMQELTAGATVWLIQMTGIPVYREGLYFTLPSGRWAIVEACSGVRYIIASVTIGTLYAYLTYRSWARRALFVVVSAIVPILANILRAYMIVMLGHMSDMTIATGADHLVYGWVFFGAVIFTLFWLGNFFRQDRLDQGSTRPGSAGLNNLPGATLVLLVVAVCGTLALAAVAPVLAGTVFGGAAAEARAAIALPLTGGAWQRSSTASWLWSPPSRVTGQQSALFARDGAILRLYLQYPDGILYGTDVIGSSAHFDRWRSGWTVVMQDRFSVQVPEGELKVDEARIRSADTELLVWSWYRLGDISTANDYHAKLRQAIVRLGFGAAGATRLIVATPMASSLAETRARLQSFVGDYVPLVYQELRQATAPQT